MSWVAIRDSILSGIADAIREKTGETSPILPGEMAAEIESIETGGGGGGVTIDEIATATDNQVLGDTVTITATELAYYGLAGRKYKNLNIINATTIQKYFAMSMGPLQTVTCPNVTVIEESAFQYCGNLTSIDLENVTKIGTLAFENCKSFTELTLPKIATIGQTPFKGSTGIKKLDLSGNNSFNNVKNLINGITQIEEIIAPHMKSVATETFYYRDALLSVICGGTVQQNAFRQCSNLKTVSIIGSTSINASAFYLCPAVKDIYVDFSAGAVSGAPWGATNATIHYNTVFDDAGNIVT